MALELRYAPMEIRMEEDGDNGRLIIGYAVKWDQLSVPLWTDQRTGKPVREQFKRGAFTEVLDRTDLDIVALRDHNRSLLLGRTENDTLTVIEDEIGLRYQIKPPETTEARDTLTLL